MKKKWSWKLVLALLGIVLAACGGLAPNGDLGNSAESAGQSVNPSESLMIIIGPELADCVGEGTQQCMQVKFGPDEEWQLLYQQIEGFDYQPGYRYTLLVEQLEVQNPPEDGSALRYVLVEVVEQEEDINVNSGELAGTYWVLDGIGDLNQPQGVLEKVIVSLQYDPDQGRLSGTAGCNNYFGDVEIDLDQLTFSAGALGMTRMACSEQVMAQEAAFVELLGKVTRFALQDGRLILFTDSDEVLTFSPGEPSAGRQ